MFAQTKESRMLLPFLGEIFAFITAVLWSGTSFVFAAATARIGAVHVNIGRLVVAIILLAVTIPLLGISWQFSMSQFMNLTLSGVAGLVFGDSFLFKAFQDIGPRYSMIIMSFAPAIAALLAYLFLGETLPILGIAGVLVTLLGIALVVTEKTEGTSLRYTITGLGLFFAFIGALGQGVGLIYAKMAFNEAELNGFIASFIRITVSTAILIPVFAALGKLTNPVVLLRNDRRACNLVLLGSIFGPYLGITFSLIAVAHAKVGIAATLMALPPILMLPMERYLYKQPLTWRAIIGAFIAVVGVAILFMR